MKPKAVIFDLDGTLLHTLPDIHKSINQMQAKLGLPLCDYESTRAGLNRGARFLVRNALPDDKKNDEALLDTALEVYTGIYAEHYADTTAPFDGVTGLVLSLHRAGLPVAVMSNKPHRFTAALVEKHFPGCFDCVVGQGEFPVKPSPEAPLAIAKRLDTNPADMFFVGDSDVDMETAGNAGMCPVAVTWGYRDAALLLRAGARLSADTPQELLDYLI